MEDVPRILAHSLPSLAVILMGYWMGRGLTAYVVKDDVVIAHDISGFSLSYGDARVFNWHPLLMSLGFVFCSMQAALAYISLPFNHAMNKRIHLSLHALGFLSAVLGAVAVFRFHNEHGITNLYSLHSWMGLGVLILFFLHWLGSFGVFFYPGAEKSVRKLIAPYHIAIGLSILGLVVATVEAGIMEKLTFNGSCNVNGELYGKKVEKFMASDCVLGNVIGLLVALSSLALVITIWLSKHEYSTTQLRDEAAPLLGSSGDEKTEISV
ncbi:cytochrome b ascorbate-dependent [Plasmopara halstedii]|uniref:Cytochrome b ascorbate-dependent n=1 Tax=Plasmopara halstedii TaxID=4781 RepID=A0A0P1ANL6_PLAHL|nr:cytochrome b ascorbate-dependent [Plasmopara halstedii]CEG42839.1 cytochrome b ascorbate-dependent [Plasmopara halstedii]|eukprot:XP_024579208.1 cytochrome b ascorbate-dependent [Plasmopara halstedii]